MSESRSPSSGELSPLKRALLTLERLQEKVRRLEGERSRPLAVVGMGCRFPAGHGPEAYFESLRRGEDSIRDRPPVPRPGWPAPEEPLGLPAAGYLDHDVSAFDPGFFGISPREAASIDPQQRLLLEVAWEALEHAGIDPRSLEGTRTGVFVGLAGNDYAQMQLASERASELLNPHFASGIGHSMASGRIAYLLGLQGPAVSVDTACSSSLVATHLACQSLRAGESDLALAAGSNLILSTDLTVAFQQSRMLAPDGRCKTFDARADGFSRGEGCGVVVLRRLEDAIREGERILAVVRGTAVNQDGPSSGLTAPNGPAQEAVIRAALEQAGLTPDDIDYIEAHGTGTSLGDPIEVQALGEVFGKRKQPLLVGSVKTNMGHLEAAAGIAGFIKVVQSLRHEEIPPHLHFSDPSPHIPWDRYSLAVPTAPTRLERGDRPRRGAVSSFGFSGTNVHVILEEAPEPATSAASADGSDSGAPEERRLHLLPVSAPSDEGLHELARRYAGHLDDSGDGFAEICHAAGTGRAHFPHRLAVVSADARTAGGNLDRWLARDESPEVRVGHRSRPDRPALAFLYTGQGAQHPGMGRELYRTSPVFRREMDRCAEILDDLLEVPLLELLDPDHPDAELIHRTDQTQPALFAVQHALTELWASWGIRPDVVLGHSIGEFAAARVAGVFSLEDALRLVTARGRAMHAVQRPGRMLAVMAPEARVAEWIDRVGGPLSLAAVNAPTQTVVSGAPDAVEAIEALAAEAGVRTKALHTSHAFHSPLMEDALQGMEDALADVTLHPAARVRFVSTVTGAAASPAELADPGYWVRQIRRPVRFADAVAVAADLSERAVEIGPHPALSGLVGQGDHTLTVHASLHREEGAWQTLLASVAELYVEGVEPDWRGLAEGRPRRPVELPSQPLQRTSLWVDMGSGGREDRPGGHPLVGSARPRPGARREFQRTVREDAPAFIGEHRVLGRTLLPGTAFVEMALTAAGRVLGGPVRLEGLDLLAAMAFDGTTRRVQVSVEPEGPSRARVEIHSVEADADLDAEWVLHATGATARSDATDPAPPADLEALRTRCPEELDVDELYASLAARDFDLGPRLRTVVEARVGNAECLTRIQLPEVCREDPGGYRIHPLLLDAALQSVGPVLDGEGDGQAYLPLGVDQVVVHADPGTGAQVHVRLTDRAERSVGADVRLLDDEGRELARMEGVRFRAVTGDELDPGSTESLFRVRWIPTDAGPDPGPATSPEVRTRVREVTEASLAREAAREDAAAYDRFVDELEDRSGSWVAHAFGVLGWDPQPGDEIALGTLAEELEVVEDRRRLLARCLDILSEDGFLEKGERGWTVLEPLGRPAPPPDADVQDEERAPPELILLERCGPHLADSLRGIGDPLELLFPGGDSRVAERMYHDTPAARIFHRSVAEAVEAVTEGLTTDRPIRILEVGAGTGGTTRHVVERLQASRSDRGPDVEYVFTDVSGLFVERARRRFEGVPGMTFRTFDLDRPAEEQGLDPESFDLVVAANCLHAARDLTDALGAVGDLLRPGGMLLAVEVFQPYRWFDLTVGLTDGWWHFTDDELRDGYPCVSPAAWGEVLERVGFHEVRPVRLSDATDAQGTVSAGQGLVLATRGRRSLEGPWLILGEGQGIGARLAGRLEDEGVDAVLLRTEGLEGEEAVAAVQRTLEKRNRWAGLVHCAASEVGGSLEPEAMGHRLRMWAASLLGAARVAVGGDPAVGQLRIVTRGGQAVDEHDADVDPAAAGLWGLVRSARLEAPDLPCRSLDLDPAARADDVETVFHWLTTVQGEPELALRGGRGLARRLVDSAEPRVRAGGGSLPSEYALTPPSGGSLDELRFSEGRRRPPGPGEVEIRVAASGLNFKDVLNVLGMYPGDPGPLGSECAGVVTAVGDGVDLARGDRVVAVAGHAYGKHVVADGTLVAPRPSGLSFVESATLPVAYLTAHFALDHLGQLGPDDRVLIHAAAGGVGSAACALAARVGAEVFATAGTEEKRELLRRRGIRHVFDSRSDAFVDGVMEATDGAGVTVVLNSLADELVDRSFDVLARGGRFLEIGKRGIWSEEQVAALDRDIEYHVIDWGRTHQEDPELVGRLFREVMSRVGEGALAPLPFTVFPLEEARDAFRYMANARHVGKVILAHPVLAMGEAVEVVPDGTYLVTGGTSGLGLATVRWLVEQGARMVVVAARSEPTEEARDALDALGAGGATIHVRRCDVGDADGVEDLLRWIAESLPPLQGVVHSAGTLADRTLPRARWEDFETVLRTKATGSANLARSTRPSPPSFFLAFSSIATVLGSPGQANHATANAVLDAFAATRWHDGTRGMSVAWGPWSETGSATDPETLARTRDLGIEALTTRQGIDALERALRDPSVHRVAMRLVHPTALAQARNDRLLESLVGRATDDRSDPAAPVATEEKGLTALLAATPADARRGVLLERVRRRVRAVLGLPQGAPLDPQRPLGDMGLDSLLAVELKNALGSELDRRLPATLLFDYPTLAALTDHLLLQLASEYDATPGDGDAEREAELAGGTGDDADHLGAVEALSDDEVDRLLSEKLERHD